MEKFITGINLKKQIKGTFPEPVSGRGIEGYEYICILLLHFVDGGRFYEDLYNIKNDNGFCEL